MVDLIMWITTIVTVSSIIAASTPTPKDDVWIGKLYKFIDLLALRARNKKGHYVADDKSTPDVNEAYTTKRVKKKVRTKKFYDNIGD